MSRLFLFLFFVSLSAHGQVARMWPSHPQSTSNTAPWQAVDPTGASINCTGTTTQCLQEFITAAATNGWDAEVNCQGMTSSGGVPAYINATSTVNVPPVQNWKFVAHNCWLVFNTTGGAPGLVLDSQARTHFEWDGYIDYFTTSPQVTIFDHTASCAVMLYPRNYTPSGAGQPEITFGLVRIANVTANSGMGAVCVDAEAGFPVNQELQFVELNGNNTTKYGFVVFAQQANTGLQVSHVQATYIHSTITAGVEIGVTSANPVQNVGTIFDLEDIEPQAGVALHTWGQNNKYRIGYIPMDSTNVTHAIVAESSSYNEQFECNYILSSTQTQIVNNGSRNQFTNCGNYGMATVANAGHQYMPSGLLENWVSTTCTHGGTSITWEQPYTSGVFGVWVAIAGGPASNQMVLSTGGPSLTGATVYSSGDSAGCWVRAIGK